MDNDLIPHIDTGHTTHKYLVLTAAQISGCRAQRIRELVKENVMMGISVNGTQYIPKSDFIAYLSTPEKLALPRTEAYKDLIREFKKRQARERENEIRRQKRKMAKELNQL